MRRLNKLLRLPAAERGLLARAAILLGAIRLGLWLLPFRTFRRLLDRVTHAPHRPGTLDRRQASPEQVVWAVTTASRYLPGARTCLVRALAAQVLLARRGHPTRLRIGVAKGEAGQLEAHAWVEKDGKVLIGGTDDLARYTGLLHLEGKGP